MPIIQIDLLEGRTKEQKAALIKDITEVVVKDTGAAKENVHIILRDMPHGNFGTCGNVK